MPDMEHLQKDITNFDQILQLCEQAKQDPSVIDQIAQIVTQMKQDDEAELGQVGQEPGPIVKGSRPGFTEKLQKAMERRGEEGGQ